MSQEGKKSLMMQGSILAIAGLISKVIGFAYRIPMANFMGNEANGLYSVAMGIYGIVLTLSSYSMPLAVSKLVSARLAKKEYGNVKRVFSNTLIFALISGGIACLFLLLGADFLADAYQKAGLQRPLRILAPTVFVVAILGTCRGYFQGHGNMLPTAVSQVAEQIVNALLSVFATYFFMMKMAENSEVDSFKAMGGTCGTLAGAMTALLFFAIIFLGLWQRKRRKPHRKTDRVTEEDALIYRAIISTIFPIIMSQTVYQIGYTLDDYIFANLMGMRGTEEAVVTSLQGIFNTQYNQMVNLPVSIATAMAAAIVPGIVASNVLKKTNEVHRKISDVLKLNMAIAIPSAVGLAVFADAIMGVLFPRLGDYHETAVLLLETGSAAVIFYALSTLTASILQGLNHMKTPVFHAAISLTLHIGIVAGLTYYTDLGVYALIIGNVTFPIIVCVLNCISVRRLIHYHFHVQEMFLKPLIASVTMGIVARLSYFGIYTLSESRMIGLAVAMPIAMGVYFFMLIIVLKGYDRSELKRLPIVKKFIR